MTMRTERDVIVDQTSRWFAHSEWSLERFASERLAVALSAAGLIEELEEPADVETYQKTRKAWSQRVARIFHATQPFPLEWKWAWLSCLPEDYQRSARSELLAMAGCFDVRIPELVGVVGVPAARAQLGQVTQAIGEFLAASAPAHDGVYDHTDSPEDVDRMLIEGTEAISAMFNELVALSTGTGRPLPLMLLANLKGEPL
ncbi:hypothetical protein [Pseudomonas sp. PE-S1G-1]|uniref:hypothetical protein n=1 Tax=Pseudomonas sp. PE-S1G-1 TaxID=1986995 RepID=UPI000B3F6E00|nr:hypothetical protein [Pseudomonas sp. PE-S1G-1]